MRQAFFRLSPCGLAAARDCGRVRGSAGARFLAAALEPLAASLAAVSTAAASAGAASPAGLLPFAPLTAPPFSFFPGPVFPGPYFPWPVFRPHRPKVRAGAAANMV